MRPSWPRGWGRDGRPPIPPANPAGCARAEGWSGPVHFPDKCEYTFRGRPDGQFRAEHLLRALPAVQMRPRMREQLAWARRWQACRLARGLSPIHGHGVFASAPIYKGEVVLEYTGERVRPSVADIREKLYGDGMGTYLWRSEEYPNILREPDYDGRPVILDATRRCNLSRFINHSCKPNCCPVLRHVAGDPGTSKRVIIIACRDIEFGEEITYDYKLPFVESKNLRTPCSCRAREIDPRTGESRNFCRGWLNWENDTPAPAEPSSVAASGAPLASAATSETG